MLDKLLPVLLPTLASLVVAGTTWVFTKLAAYLQSKSQGSKLFQALAIINDLVSSTVQDIEANEKPILLASGGAMTSAIAAQLKSTAMNRIKAHLGTDGLATLEKLLGTVLGSPDLDKWISGKIEQAVAAVPVSPK